MIRVLGSINIDITMKGARLPGPGETVPATHHFLAPGGKGANQALAAARAGVRVAMAGAVGRDSHADLALANLHQAGIDLEAVARLDEPTGAALIMVAEDGENAIMVHPGANGRVDALLARAACIGLGPHDVLLLQQEIPRAAVAEAIAAARSAGARSILNIAPLKDWTEQVAAEADIVIGNEHELAGLARAIGAPDDSPETLAARLGRIVVATLGPRGALACAPGQPPVSAPAPVVEAIDTVGAGDAFCGYFAAALAEGAPLPDALGLGVAAGSLTCTRPGAQAAIPARADVDRLCSA
ncbi:ribokinase [Albidovulum inexpectatum]|uniref:Ribokinase n=1 Tax=Albidovulum inexpectatum TaxID=196587 RepID=A0A2S5JGT5_9RHOB|nr:ribokinase [Albidovulum inexpectatum]PPB80726.1 ribokinase [Albidovulum inexpectatum]